MTQIFWRIRDLGLFEEKVACLNNSKYKPSWGVMTESAAQLQLAESLISKNNSE